jgi:hypothetical protein
MFGGLGGGGFNFGNENDIFKQFFAQFFRNRSQGNQKSSFSFFSSS